ncbi:MAG: zinc-ribbon domain-containing protein, partial [Candidatus Eremiobacterota bacterium]
MECPKCRYESLPGAHFCEKCGFDLKAFRARRTASPPPPAR